MEDFGADIDYIARKMKIKELFRIKDRRENHTKGKSTTQQEERILSYFSLLEKDVKERLFNLYKMDFEMFGYDATKYI